MSSNYSKGLKGGEVVRGHCRPSSLTKQLRSVQPLVLEFDPHAQTPGRYLYRERVRLDLRTREKVVLLKKQGYVHQEIAQRLKEENISISIKSLYLLSAKYRYTNSVVDKPPRS